jgi:HlyD family secretion protein
MTEQMTAPAKGGHTKTVVIVLVLLLLIGGGATAAWYYLMPDEVASVASFPVQQGEFVISLELKGGELEAIKAENVTAPHVRGELKITHLFPEGEKVQIGDLLADFDNVEFLKRVTDADQALEVAKAELAKSAANQSAEQSRLDGELKNQEAQLRLAELQVEKMKFESTMQKEETQLTALQAELRLEQAQSKLESQIIIDGAEKKQLELDISRKVRNLEKARADLNNLKVKAEKPGLVVYAKKWSPSGPVKVRVGDEIWGGQALISLPDLTHMRVKTYVNEVDVDKMEKGQLATIKLDALSEPTFHGRISSIANLGREKEGDRNLKVFDVEIEIEGEDNRLKPGMSATCTVIIETIPPRAVPQADTVKQEITAEIPDPAPEPLYIPIDAVFEREGETIVYRLADGQPVEQVVVLGKRNDNYVIVEEGLGPDDKVTLRDPTIILDKLGGAPDEGGGKSASETLK